MFLIVVMKTLIVPADPITIEKSAQMIRAGGLVAFPTETVYGLGANALSGTAVAKIFEAKGRPQFNPLITHFLSAEEVEQHAVMNEDAHKLAHHFWPGALTMILPRKADSEISDLVCAGLSTIAVRVPAHKTARLLLKEARVPISAPSANASGEVSPTAPAHVFDSLAEKIELILADGSCDIGLESTVIDLTSKMPLVLRPGSVTCEELGDVLGCDVMMDLGDCDRPRSPGQTLKHYAPSKPLRLNAVDIHRGEALLAFGSVKYMGIKGGGAAKDLPEDMIRNLSEGQDLYEAAANLFAMLRALDKPGRKGIAVMNIPDQGIGIAINERLRRAAEK